MSENNTNTPGGTTGTPTTTDGTNDVLFDMNSGTNLDTISISNTSDVLDELNTSGVTPEITEARKRVIRKIMGNVSFRSTGMVREFNYELMDQDIFTLGKMNGANLRVDTGLIIFTIDLSVVISKALIDKRSDILQLLLDNNVDFSEVEPKTLIMCLETECWGLMKELIQKKFPIDFENYKVIYQLANIGRLDILKLIFEQYKFTNLHNIVSKICVNAVIYGHLNVLKYFYPESEFVSTPDFRYVFIKKGIEHGGHLEIIKYLVGDDFNITQEDYNVVRIALQFKRTHIIHFFYSLNPNIINIISEDEKIIYGFAEMPKVIKYIGTQTNCNIYYNDIEQDSEYYICSQDRHYFSRNAWDKWSIKKADWKCPHCFSDVRKIIYINHEK